MTTQITAPKAHSYSRLQVFSECPLAYKLTYMDKAPQEDSGPMEIGAAAHEFFEYWVLEGKPELLEKPGYLEGLAADIFQKEARDQSNFKDYLEICRTFARAYKPDPAYPQSRCEKEVAFNREWKPCHWFSKDVMFRAKIDRVDEPLEAITPDDSIVRKVRIVDYKTGFAGTMDTFQLDIYALLASLIYPSLQQVEVEFYYVRSGFKQVKLLNVDDMGTTKIQLEALMARIEGEVKFKAKPGSRCLNCGVAAACTEKPADLRPIDSLDVAKSLGAEIAFLSAQAASRKKSLKAWCKEHGSVETNGLIYDHYPSESMVIEIAPLLSACVSYQIDPGQILNPDSRAIKKAFKNNPGFAEAISPYMGIDVSMSFKAKKASGEEE